MKSNLRRVIQDIEALSAFSSTPGNGVTRLAFTEEDRMAREYIKKQMSELALRVWEDGYGNLFGRKEGTNSNAPLIMLGSHYDSVTNGGPFDGVAGLAAALEVIRVFKENQIENYYPIEIVAMNDEEGVRFGTGISNSRVMAGLMEEEELDRAKDQDGITLREAMEIFGVTPDLESAKRPSGSIKAYLELLIEQGPIMESTGKELGLVETIVGLDKYEVVFNGKSGHAGTTPMDNRRDALIAASEFILAVNRIVKDIGDGTVGTVGQLSLSPNAPNVIPGHAHLSVDIRSTKEDNMKEAYARLVRGVEPIKEKANVEITISHGLSIPPVNMSEEHIRLMESLCQRLGYSSLRMNSGAGHDAMAMAKVAPTSLVFVPSKDGLSHHPDEWTDYEDLEKGIELMLHTVLELSSDMVGR